MTNYVCMYCLPPIGIKIVESNQVDSSSQYVLNIYLNLLSLRNLESQNKIKKEVVQKHKKYQSNKNFKYKIVSIIV